MKRLIKRRSKKAGLSPGTLVYIGDRKAEKVGIEIIDYSESRLQEKEARHIEECFPFKNKPTVTWVDITGVHQTEVVEKIGKHFGVHPLVLEDIVNTNQRPKLEDFETYLFVVLNMVYYDGKSHIVITEQLSLIIGPNFVISFQEVEGDVFDSVRKRIRNSKGKIRKSGSDYLAYALMDAVVDNYFIVLEKVGEEIEDLEDELIKSPSNKTLSTIHGLKRELIFLRKSVWPLREVISNMERGDSKLIKKATGIYLRDVYDHTIQVIDTIETFRDMVSGMVDVYLSSVSNRMNEVMKVLTVIATIFIPLTFIAGIYGMNFKYMPELEWVWAYPLVWVVVLSIGISMFVYFKKRRWV